MALLLLVALFANRYSIVLATTAAVSIVTLFYPSVGPQILTPQPGGLGAGYVLLSFVAASATALALASGIYFGRKWLMAQFRRKPA